MNKPPAIMTKLKEFTSRSSYYRCCPGRTKRGFIAGSRRQLADLCATRHTVRAEKPAFTLLLCELRPSLLVMNEVQACRRARSSNKSGFGACCAACAMICVSPRFAPACRPHNALRTNDKLVHDFKDYALPPWLDCEELTDLMSTLTRSLPLRRKNRIDTRILARFQSVTGGITDGIFSVMSQLALATIGSGEEQITPGDVCGTGRLPARS